MVVIACCHGWSPSEGRNICIIVPWSGSDTVLRVAILHLGIGRPLAALPDPLEAAAVHKRCERKYMSWAGPRPWGVVGPIGLLRHRRITFFATLSGTLCTAQWMFTVCLCLRHQEDAVEPIESDHEPCSRCGCKLEFRNTVESPTTQSLVCFFRCEDCGHVHSVERG